MIQRLAWWVEIVIQRPAWWVEIVIQWRETGLVGGDCTVVGGGYWAVGTFLLSRKVELTWRVGAVDLKRLKLLVIVEMGNDGNSFGGAVRK